MRVRSRRRGALSALRAGAATAVLLVSSHGWAQSAPLDAGQRHWLTVSATAASVRTATRESGWYQDPSAYRAEGDLGLPRRATVAGLTLGRRIGERWRIEVDWTHDSRAGQTLLRQDLRAGYTTFDAGTVLATKQTLESLRVTTGRSFLLNPQAEFTIILGGALVVLEQDFRGTSGPPGNAAASAEESSLLPLVGLHGSWRPGPAWTLAARAEVGAGDRHLLVWAAALWQATPHLAFSLGWRHVDLRLNYNAAFISVNQVSLHHRASGPRLAAQVSF